MHNAYMYACAVNDGGTFETAEGSPCAVHGGGTFVRSSVYTYIEQEPVLGQSVPSSTQTKTHGIQLRGASACE